MSTRRWSDAELQAARMTGDPEADALVEKVLDKDSRFLRRGRLDYNYFLAIADTLTAGPEIALVRDSRVSEALADYPPEIVEYFGPVEAPDWVLPEKLELASRVWAENEVAIIYLLYAASLPACYLIKHGIPALYETARLTDRRYIYQRIYETGLFIEAAMSRGGLRILTDVQTFDEIAGSAPSPSTPKRYLWGKGYVATKKVRFLHASMRFMLTQPKRVQGFAETTKPVSERLSQLGESAWNEGELGKPVNQEDLAYTLLTFSYLIPLGLAKWGCRLSDEETQAYMHAWKLIGHVLGIQPHLLTDDWDESVRLFETIRARQAGSSDQGKVLADALMTFLQGYLPPTLILRESIPPLLIERQIGRHYADMIFTERWKKASRSLLTRFSFNLGRSVLWAYYFIRNWLLRHSATAAGFVGSVLSQAGNELIQSWRDEYRHRLFDVPDDATRQELTPAAARDTQFPLRLRRWRHLISYTIGGGVALLMASVLCLGAGAVLLLFGYLDDAVFSGRAALVSLLASLLVLKTCVPALSRNRPKPAAQAA